MFDFGHGFRGRTPSGHLNWTVEVSRWEDDSLRRINFGYTEAIHEMKDSSYKPYGVRSLWWGNMGGSPPPLVNRHVERFTSEWRPTSEMFVAAWREEAR